MKSSGEKTRVVLVYALIVFMVYKCSKQTAIEHVNKGKNATQKLIPYRTTLKKTLSDSKDTNQ